MRTYEQVILLKSIMQSFQAKRQSGNAHADHQSYDLDNIFCIKETRILMNDFTVTFNKHIFQLHAQQRTIIRPKDVISIHVHLDDSIRLFVRKTELFFTEIVAKKPKMKEGKVTCYKPRKISENSRNWASGTFMGSSRVKPAVPAAEAKL